MYGEWFVVEKAIKVKDGRLSFLCKCSCGISRVVANRALVSGKSLGCTSCGPKVRSEDLTGRVFGMVTVLSEGGRGKHNQRVWLCSCKCGEVLHVRQDSLKSTVLQGCRECKIEDKNPTCGRKNTHRLYATWNGMKQRCYNEKATCYEIYGGLGVRVCSFWLESFENFLSDMGSSFEEGKTLDRIDPYGNYELNNCRWASSIEQARNKRCKGGLREV